SGARRPRGDRVRSRRADHHRALLQALAARDAGAARGSGLAQPADLLGERIRDAAVAVQRGVTGSVPITSQLLEHVLQQLDGFKVNKAKRRFERRAGDGVFHRFFLVCTYGGPLGFRVRPEVAVRIDRVEDIYHRVSGMAAKYHRGTSTMGTAVGELIGGGSRAGEFRLLDVTDLTGAAAGIISLFRSHAVPYFERWSSLQNIDSELNGEPWRRSLHR